MPESSFFQTFGEIAGLGGLALAVLLSIFLAITKNTNLFPRLKKDDAYRLMRLIVVCTWSIAVLSLVLWAGSALFGGNRQTVIINGSGSDIEQSINQNGEDTTDQSIKLNGNNNKVRQSSQ